MRLDTRLHDRDNAGLKYVYPVVSRRARGVSVGVNLNPNNACNWRCIYCQVPNLVPGVAPEIDLDLLESELDRMLGALVQGDYMERHVPAGARRLNDVAISGNGESTTSPQLPEVLRRIARSMESLGLLGETKLVLITNGSLVHRPHVQEALRLMAGMRGEVWYKLDSATAEGQAQLNDAHAGIARAEQNLRTAAVLCPTWLQTCVLELDGEPPSAAERRAYLKLVARLVADEVPLRGVLLYGLERKSYQPEAPRLGKLPAEWLEAFAREIETAGLAVQVSP